MCWILTSWFTKKAINSYKSLSDIWTEKDKTRVWYGISDVLKKYSPGVAGTVISSTWANDYNTYQTFWSPGHINAHGPMWH